MAPSDPHQGELTVRPAGPRDAAAWDAFVDGFPHHSPLARFLWRDILERRHGGTAHFLIAETPGGAIEGVVATYIVRSLRGRKRLFTLQRGLLATGTAATQQLGAALAALIQREGISGGNITGETPEPLAGLAASETTTLVIPLLGNDDENWAALRDKTRNMVRKAERSGITVRRGLAHLPALYDIYAREMVARGIPIYSRGLWEDAARAFGDNARILVAQHDGRTIGGVFLLFGRATACDFFQASRLETRKLAPIPLLLWESMRDATAMGLSRLDLGPSTPGGNTYKAKTNFGGVPETFAKYDLTKPRRPDDGEGASTARVAVASAPSLRARADTYLSQHAWWPIRYRFNLWKRRQTSMF